jgi:hypothetical protein
MAENYSFRTWSECMPGTQRKPHISPPPRKGVFGQRGKSPRVGLYARVSEFVKEGLTFTGDDSPMANLMLSVMGAFAEFERSLIRERQREGIALARQRGAYRGRKKSLSPERIEELRRRATSGEKKLHLARDFGISRETLYQYLKPEAVA